MHLRRCLLSLFALAALSPPALFAQARTSGTIPSTGGGASCVSINVDAQATVGMQVVGTWTGTLQPEISLQGQAPANTQVTPSTSATPASTITANGVYRASVAGGSTFLLCGNTVASGTANIYLNAAPVSAGLGGGGGGAGTGACTNQFVTAVNAGVPTCASVTPTQISSLSSGALDLTAQAASLSATTVFTTTSAGTYLVSCYVVLTQAATTSSTLPACFVKWTDKDTSVVQPGTAQVSTNALTGNTVGLSGASGGWLGSQIVQAASGSAIQVLTTNYISSGATPMQYALHAKVVFLGI